MFAFLRFELHAKGFFQRGAHGGERRQIARTFDTGAGIACIRGEEESDILGIVQWRGVKQNAFEIFGKAFAKFVGDFARMRGGKPK